MTIICIRDGVMAVDSLVTEGEIVAGSAIKWRSVGVEHGGGFLGGSGDLAVVTLAMASYPDGQAPSAPYQLLHLRADGSVLCVEQGGAVFVVTAAYHAVGSGFAIAMGAMAAGASAMRAAEIACELCTSCGGPVVELRLADTEAAQ